MRIVQLISHYVPASRFGGPQRVAHGLGKALAQAGHEVQVCCTNLADEISDLDVTTDGPVDVDGVEVYYQPTVISRYWGFSPKLWRRAKLLIRDADVVLVHFHYQFANLAGAFFSRRLGKPYLVFAHGSFQRAGIARRSAWKKRAYLQYIESANLRDAYRIVFNAEEEKKNSRFGDIGIVLRNGISPEELTLPSIGKFRSNHPAVGDKRMLLFLGRIDYKGKGLDFLLEAYKRLSPENCHLVLAGPSEREGMELTKAAIAELELEDHVTLTGLIDGTEKLAALADADAFLLPSRSEGLSIALLEALCVGLPVMVTDRVGLHEFVADSGAGVVTKVSVDAYTDGLREILDDDRRQKMIGAASPRIREEYSWNAIAGDLTEIIETAVRG